jgi:dethiobiotin synthetase
VVRPQRLVLVVGTGTEVGKTWVSALLLSTLRAAGVTVAARKPAQSFDPPDDPAMRDAAVLGRATGEPPETVCPPARWYEVAMAPPMAAEVLGRAAFTVDDLCGEITWPAERVSVGLIEGAGGVRSPLAADGDAVDLMLTMGPDLVVLVADAGLGTINSVRLSVAALSEVLTSDAHLLVVLNRYDPTIELHVRNRQWLADRDGFPVLTVPDGLGRLVSLVQGA